MRVTPEQIQEWKEQVLSANMMDVLNAMMAIGRSGDPQTASLLEIAGKNVNKMVLNRKLGGPAGPMTFEEFRATQLGLVKNLPPSANKTAAQQELEMRVERFMQFAIRAPATFVIDHSVALLRQLVEASGRNPQASPAEIYCQVRGWTSIRRAEDADPTGGFGGQFAYLTERIDDPECRALFARVQMGRRVEFTKDLYDLRRIRSFWMREVRPQQFAFYRLDLLSRFEHLPADGWTVGPV